MSDQPHKELISSLKELYTSGEYSDLTITCHSKHYRVHKAVVCPRSDFFSSACREASPEAASNGHVNGHVNLPDDDPVAVDMVVHYLYHLDYSVVAQDPRNGHVNGERQIFENGDTVSDVTYEDKEEPVPSEAPDEPKADKSAKKKVNKKKNKKKASIDATVESSINGSPISLTDLKDPAFEEREVSDKPLPVEEFVEPLTSNSLTAHAKVYALGKKYGINGLKLLALEKFQSEVQSSWATDEFLQAASLVYTSTSAADSQIRDAVAATLYQHPELLDKKETQQMMKGLELGFDVLLRVRANGGFSNEAC